ncbi:hypothetical protein FOL47_011222 [Perkinsus chesapeaki]|uniref:subtilisin n=1 Tax=Perkinsus chesapeaki TaxID=330153 RepID=A0A7J6L0L2_PERCH|nr:hypothetical protein FOL47_011222 [Perkinsus chesapeaki]
MKAMKVPAAWKVLWNPQRKRGKVTVALCDSGISRHPDLVGNLVPGYNVLDHNTETTDKLGHGTVMAGILGATINNKLAMAGVSDLVNLMPVALGPAAKQQLVLDAFNYVIQHRAERNIKIILMPISFVNPAKKLVDA